MFNITFTSKHGEGYSILIQAYVTHVPKSKLLSDLKPDMSVKMKAQNLLFCSDLL